LFHSDDNSSEDIQKEPNHPLTRPSFFKSLTSLSTLGRPSHDYGNGRTSISSNDARQSFNKSRVSSNGQGKYVIGAGFSYMDTASPSPTPSAGNLSESPVITPVVAKTNLDTTYTHHQHAHHHRHNHSHQGTRAISGSDEEDDVWSADIDDIPGDSGTSANRKSIKVDKTQLYPSLAGLTLENKTENEEFSRFAGKSGSDLNVSQCPHAVKSTASNTNRIVSDSKYSWIRSDWRELMANPFSVLTKYVPNDKEAIKYKKIVRVLTKEPFDLGELRKQSWSGIPASIRPLVWQILIGYLPANRGTRTSVLNRKRKEYSNSIQQLLNGQKDQTIWHQIEIDVPRTNPGISLYAQESTHRSLERILYMWAVRHAASGYVQGINDLVTPYFQVFLSAYLCKPEDVVDFDPKNAPQELMTTVEADTYWCLTKMLDTIQDNYIHEQPGIIRQIDQLKDLITRDEPRLAKHLAEQNLDFIQFAFRWMNCLLMREFELPLVIRMWDTYLSDFPNGFSKFHVYVCCAFLRRFGDVLINMEFQDIIMFLQDSKKTDTWTEKDIEMMLSEAYVWESLYENASAHLK